MTTTEKKLKTLNFWLRLGAINHTIAIVAIMIGCANSGFTCQGESMKDVLSVYAFTLFTPQLALEVILLMALFLICNSWRQINDSRFSLGLFILTLTPLILFLYWQ